MNSVGNALEREQLEQSGELFGRCAGVWALFSATAQAEGKGASAEQWHMIENGALTASAWSYAMRYQLLNAGEPPKPISHFMARAESHRDTTRVALLADAENGRVESIRAQVQLCESTREAQQSIIDSIRDTADK